MNLDNQQPMEEFSDDAAMAKADLYKAGKYSLKLIKMFQDGQELPGWVQAKITKAADYIASVYHFMEFDIKKSEFGDHVDNSDMYEEHLKNKFQKKLMEAKANLKEQPKKAPKKKSMCGEDCSKCTESCDDRLEEGAFLGNRILKMTHPEHGPLELVNLGREMSVIVGGTGFDDIKGDPKEMAAVWHDLAKDVEKFKQMKKQHHDQDAMMKGGFRPMTGVIRRSADESRINEKSKPSAGMTKKEKSSVVKQAKAGKDLGKPGKGFEKVEKAAKKSGARDPKAVAAAQMWKQQAKKG